MIGLSWNVGWVFCLLFLTDRWSIVLWEPIRVRCLNIIQQTSTHQCPASVSFLLLLADIDRIVFDFSSSSCVLSLLLGSQKCSSVATLTADGRWPDLVGRDAQDARNHILSESPSLHVQILPADMMMTMDYNTNRVRIIVNSEQKVVKCPTIGWLVENLIPSLCIFFVHQKELWPVDTLLWAGIRSGTMIILNLVFYTSSVQCNGFG